MASFVYNCASFVDPGIRSMSVPSSEKTHVKGKEVGHSHLRYHCCSRVFISTKLYIPHSSGNAFWIFFLILYRVILSGVKKYDTEITVHGAC